MNRSIHHPHLATEDGEQSVEQGSPALALVAYLFLAAFAYLFLATTGTL